MVEVGDGYGYVVIMMKFEGNIGNAEEVDVGDDDMLNDNIVIRLVMMPIVVEG